MKVNLTLEERQREVRGGREGEEKKTEIKKKKKKQEEEGRRRMERRKSRVVCACQVASVLSDSL